MTLDQRGSLEPYLKDDVEFYPHQIDGIRQLAYWPSFICADDMGLGKTLEALTVFCIDVFQGFANTGLVVCPPSLIGNWVDEIEKFTRLKYMVVDGPPLKRSEQMIRFVDMSAPKLMITNYEKVIKHGRIFNAMRFDAGIFDEAHYLRGPETARTQAVHGLANGRSMLLTGTPMLNHVDDLWGLLHKVDPNRFPRFHKFVNRYAVFGGYKDKTVVGTKNEAELKKILSQYMLRRTKGEVLKLDKPTIFPRRVTLHPEQRKIYDRMVQEMKVTRPEDIDDEDLKNHLAKFTRLKQVCSTTKSFNGQDISAKLDLVIEDDLELLANGEKIIVFTQFREVQECYIERIKRRTSYPVYELNGDVSKEKRPWIVKDWSAHNGPAIIVCMIQVAGVGLNMVAASEVSFIDKLFVPGLNRQAVDRSHRIGQTRPVRVREYQCRNTIEYRVEEINQQKDRLFGQLIEDQPEWKKRLLDELIRREKESDEPDFNWE